jgi:hypothetical protein
MEKIMILDYIKDIQTYIVNEFNNDTTYANDKSKLKVDNAYTTDKPYAPCIAILLMDDYEDTSNKPYDVENTRVLPLQFYCYGKKMTHNGVLRSPYEMALIIADKLREILNRHDIINNNNNIISISRTGTTPPMPLEEGSEIYFVAQRYSVKVRLDYEKIY